MNIHQFTSVIQCEGHTNVKSQFPPEIRHELSRDHGPDPGSSPGRALDQEVLTLAWEAYSHRLPLKQAGSHIRRGLYAFVRSVGWGRLWDRADPKRQYTRSPRWERVILYGQD